MRSGQTLERTHHRQTQAQTKFMLSGEGTVVIHRGTAGFIARVGERWRSWTVQRYQKLWRKGEACIGRLYLEVGLLGHVNFAIAD